MAWSWLMGHISASISYMFYCLTAETEKDARGSSYIQNSAVSKCCLREHRAGEKFQLKWLSPWLPLVKVYWAGIHTGDRAESCLRTERCVLRICSGASQIHPPSGSHIFPTDRNELECKPPLHPGMFSPYLYMYCKTGSQVKDCLTWSGCNWSSFNCGLLFK